jgi:acetolactate synthase-1/2/3 large subunit
MPAWRCESVEGYRDRLAAALELDVPSLIALPIDYSVDIAVATELGTETTTRI